MAAISIQDVAILVEATMKGTLGASKQAAAACAASSLRTEIDILSSGVALSTNDAEVHERMGHIEAGIRPRVVAGAEGKRANVPGALRRVRSHAEHKNFGQGPDASRTVPTGASSTCSSPERIQSTATSPLIVFDIYESEGFLDAATQTDQSDGCHFPHDLLDAGTTAVGQNYDEGLNYDPSVDYCFDLDGPGLYQSIQRQCMISTPDKPTCCSGICPLAGQTVEVLEVRQAMNYNGKPLRHGRTSLVLGDGVPRDYYWFTIVNMQTGVREAMRMK